MKKIKKITEFIKEEIQDAEKYIEYANKSKNNGDDKIYATALKLAQEELAHAMQWHDVAVAEIDKAKMDLSVKGEEVPKFMLDYWNDEHEKYIEQVAKVKYMIDLIK